MLARGGRGHHTTSLALLPGGLVAVTRGASGFLLDQLGAIDRDGRTSALLLEWSGESLFFDEDRSSLLCQEVRHLGPEL